MLTCHACGSTALTFLPSYGNLGRVTSDCQPWPKGGRLGLCRACGLAQKAVDPAWTKEIGEIYANYAIYSIGDGAEQAVFTSGTGVAQARSERILEGLQASVAFPAEGRWLDLGCGNGALLQALSRKLGGWSLIGQELGDKNRRVIEAIPHVEAFHTCPAGEIPGGFDAISLVHVLEHIPAPGAYLADLRTKLGEHGLLVIQVPNFEQNPFDLLIADHATHFSPATLAAVVRGAGYTISHLAVDWVPRELTLVARPGAPAGGPAPVPPEAALMALGKRLEWLEGVTAAARGAAKARPFGIFGTSIAGTWLHSQMGEGVDFFMDEDPSRVGKTYLGLPILKPEDAPRESTVFLALAAPLAQKLKTRFEAAPYPFHAIAPEAI